jgi:hypothetical protein
VGEVAATNENERKEKERRKKGKEILQRNTKYILSFELAHKTIDSQKTIIT